MLCKISFANYDNFDVVFFNFYSRNKLAKCTSVCQLMKKQKGCIYGPHGVINTCYGCESWTLTERRIQAFQNKCCTRMFGISYREHETNEYVWQQVSVLAGRQEFLLSTVKCRRLLWFGHVCRHDTSPKIIPQGTVDGLHRRGRPQSWKNNEMNGQAS